MWSCGNEPVRKPLTCKHERGYSPAVSLSQINSHLATFRLRPTSVYTSPKNEVEIISHSIFRTSHCEVIHLGKRKFVGPGLKHSVNSQQHTSGPRGSPCRVPSLDKTVYQAHERKLPVGLVAKFVLL
jgi:hypothetical protein